ncbi:MAG TPA: EamA family transporter [Candidatus Aquilonibacter sp.]|nr:EamA family transporter [Candidatus Aquilonibacter sp.]
MCLIWGTTWLAIKIGLHGLQPITGVGFRFVLAGLLLYGVAAASGRLRPLRELPWRVILVYSTMLFGIDYVLTYTAETRLDSGLVAVLFSTLPFFNFAFGRFMIGEHATPRVWLGATIACVGIAVMCLSGQVRGSPLYALAAIGSAAGSAFANVYAKKHSHHDPLVTLPPSMLISGLVLSVAGTMFEATDWHAALAPSSLLALAYLAVFGSAGAFFLMMWLLRRIPAWGIGVASTIFPMVAIIVGALFGGEQFGMRDLAGCVLVLGGVALALTVSGTSPERT